MGRRAARVSGIVAAAAAAGVCLAPSGVAQAQTPSEIAVAKQWFSDGLAREEKGDFVGALALFRRAVQVKRTPQIVYHVGLCESRSGALVEALGDLDGAVALAKGAHADDVVAAAQGELADVKGRVPSLEVHLRGDASTATRFLVDGSSIALSLLGTPMPLDPGEHTVTIELASGGRAMQKATLVEHDAKLLELVTPDAPAVVAAPTPAPGAAPVTPLPSSAASPPATVSRSSTTEWVLVGAGAALVVGGASLMAAARVKESSLNTSCPSHAQCDPSLEGSYDTAGTFNSVGIGLGLVGLAAAGVGISMLVLRPSATTATAVVVSPRGVAFSGSF